MPLQVASMLPVFESDKDRLIRTLLEKMTSIEKRLEEPSRSRGGRRVRQQTPAPPLPGNCSSTAPQTSPLYHEWLLKHTLLLRCLLSTVVQSAEHGRDPMKAVKAAGSPRAVTLPPREHQQRPAPATGGRSPTAQNPTADVVRPRRSAETAVRLT